ncbi:MAG TPA: hypothetical protein VK826_02160 [Bacteroidia bacterium]|nr:hypothetical protein [Bacteroidia bacterium]
MKFRFSLKRILPFLLLAAMIFASCGGEKICAGLNKETGKSNTSKGARRGNRGGYKTPGELSARDRQKKRIKKSKRRAAKGRSTTGKKGFRIGFSVKGRSGKVKGSGGGRVRS